MEVGLEAKNAKSCLHDVFPAFEVSYLKVSRECVQFGCSISLPETRVLLKVMIKNRNGFRIDTIAKVRFPGRLRDRLPWV